MDDPDTRFMRHEARKWVCLLAVGFIQRVVRTTRMRIYRARVRSSARLTAYVMAHPARLLFGPADFPVAAQPREAVAADHLRDQPNRRTAARTSSSTARRSSSRSISSFRFAM